jgi:hypothetical protein
MDCVDPLVTVLLDAIRNRTVHRPNLPIQFITGHTHRRAFQVLDPYAASFEPGHYLDTVGFVSFPLDRSRGMADDGSASNTTAPHRTKKAMAAGETVPPGNALRGKSSTTVTEVLPRFQHVYFDANVDVLRDSLGKSHRLDTVDGKRLEASIWSTRHALGLDARLGCAPRSYYLGAPLHTPSSLWELYLRQVLPSQLLHGNESVVFLQRTGALRYSLLRGDVTLDDVIAVDPFNDTVYVVTDRILGEVVARAFANLTRPEDSGDWRLPAVGMTALHIDASRSYALLTGEYEVPFVTGLLQRAVADASGLHLHPRPLRCSTPGSHDCIYTANLWRDFVRSAWPDCPAASPAARPSGSRCAARGGPLCWDWFRPLSLVSLGGVVALVLMWVLTRLLCGPRPWRQLDPQRPKLAGGGGGGEAPSRDGAPGEVDALLGADSNDNGSSSNNSRFDGRSPGVLAMTPTAGPSPADAHASYGTAPRTSSARRP